MKKIIISSLIILVSYAINAQEAIKDSVLRSKKGIPVLPQKGDWAIGADALPYLEYVGNIFNNTQGNSLNLDDQTLYGRYFISDNTAIRASLHIDGENHLNQVYVADDAAHVADPLSNAKTTDTYKYIYSYHSLELAYQKFRGYGRLRGFYGANVGFGFSRERYKYTYGNPISVANPTPHIGYGSYTNGKRVLEIDNGNTKSIMVGVLAGVEYYFAPKICIGGEISLSLSSSWNSQGDGKYERLNGSIVEESKEAITPKGRDNTIFATNSPSNYRGSLYLMFHF
jgi:hypothetical protein